MNVDPFRINCYSNKLFKLTTSDADIRIIGPLCEGDPSVACTLLFKSNGIFFAVAKYGVYF